MSQSPAEIASLAMTLLKKNAVVSMDDLTIEAQQCSIWLPILRDQLLEQYAFTFATKRVQLEALTDAPAYQYLYQYPVPEDCLMELEARADIFTTADQTTNPPIIAPGGMGIEFTWLVEGGNIITNANAVFLKYSADVTETGLYTPSFTLALAYRIAGTLAYPLTGNDKLAAMLIKASDDEAKRAQSRDAQKGSQEPFVQHDSWIGARNSTYLSYKHGSWLRQGQTE